MGIATTNLSAVNRAEEVVVNQTLDGVRKTSRMAVEQLALQLAGTAPLNSLAGGTMLFETRAQMNASLAHEAPLVGWVYADPTAGNNGIYVFVEGTPNTWVRKLDLPYTQIKLTDAGAGTANAVIATSVQPLPTVPLAALLLLSPFEANTGPVTLAVNGAPAKPLVTNSGNALSSGGYSPGMLLALVDTGANFRLLSDVASASIQAAAEAARDRAQEWSESPVDDEVTPGAFSARHWAAKAAASAEDANLSQIKVDAEAARDAAGDSAASSSASSTASATSASNAATQRAAAQAARTGAEAARDAAMAAGKIYLDTTAGLAAVANGEYFLVPSPFVTESVILYRDVSGVATEIKRYPSALALPTSIETTPGVAWAVVDQQGRAALSVLDSGRVEIADLNGQSAADIFNAVSFGLNGSAEARPGAAFAVVDSEGRGALVVEPDGTVAVGVLKAEKVSITGSANLNPYGGYYRAETVFINNMGQSLSEGSNGTITTVQEYDNVGFPARASSPAATVPLTVADTQVSGRGESPLYGTLGHIKELILEEAGLAYTDHSYQLIGCCNGYSGYGINALKKGTAPYTAAVSQVTAGYSLAQAAGESFAVGAMTWTQGESDAAMARATYRDLLKQLAVDWDTDCKAITGQLDDIPLISYQVATTAGRVTALAQLDAADQSALVHIACPMYQFDYYDTQHINAVSAKWLGGYYGLAYKRIVIDGENWRPLRPVSHLRQGNVVLVTFDTPVRPLVFDTTQMPAQVNFGFSAVDAANADLAISSVSIAGPDTVKFVFAASPAGGKLRYGFNDCIGKGAFTGGGGNLRDSQGVVYGAINRQMHNWCLISEHAL